MTLQAAAMATCGSKATPGGTVWQLRAANIASMTAKAMILSKLVAAMTLWLATAATTQSLGASATILYGPAAVRTRFGAAKVPTYFCSTRGVILALPITRTRSWIFITASTRSSCVTEMGQRPLSAIHAFHNLALEVRFDTATHQLQIDTGGNGVADYAVHASVARITSAEMDLEWRQT